VSRIGREGTKVFWPQYSADAKACVNFSADGSAVARNWKGEELWSLRGVYPLTGATLAPSPVLFLTDRAGRDVRAVRIADGKEVWRDGWMDGKHILAGSSDGRQLALWEGNQLQLVKLEGAKIKIGPAEKKTEACFSPNAKLLVYLPSLEIAGDDPQRLPVLKRANRLAQLVDCRTGQVIKRFALKPPAPASQSKPAVEENQKPPASVPAAELQAARPKYRPARSKPAPAPAAAPAPRNSAFD
jgi:hypothetical protein